MAVQNKILAAHMLSKAEIPVAQSWVTSDFSLLCPLVKCAPLIINSYMGQKSESCRVVRCADDLDNLCPPQTPVLIQEYFDAPVERLRLYANGEEVSAVRILASRCGSFGVEPVPLTPDLRGIAASCGTVFNLSLYSVDVVECPAGLKVVDVAHFPDYEGIPAAGILADCIEDYATGIYRLPESSISERASGQQKAAQIPGADAKTCRRVV